MHKRIIALLMAGNFVETVCAECKIPKSSYYLWIQKAKKGQEPYKSFAADVANAMAVSEIKDLETIRLASQVHWQAAAWRLERRFPDRWRRHEKHEVVGAGGGPVQVVTLAELEAIKKTCEDNEQ